MVCRGCLPWFFCLSAILANAECSGEACTGDEVEALKVAMLQSRVGKVDLVHRKTAILDELRSIDEQLANLTSPEVPTCCNAGGCTQFNPVAQQCCGGIKEEGHAKWTGRSAALCDVNLQCDCAPGQQVVGGCTCSADDGSCDLSSCDAFTGQGKGECQAARIIECCVGRGISHDACCNKVGAELGIGIMQNTASCTFSCPSSPWLSASDCEKYETPEEREVCMSTERTSCCINAGGEKKACCDANVAPDVQQKVASCKEVPDEPDSCVVAYCKEGSTMEDHWYCDSPGCATCSACASPCDLSACDGISGQGKGECEAAETLKCCELKGRTTAMCCSQVGATYGFGIMNLVAEGTCAKCDYMSGAGWDMGKCKDGCDLSGCSETTGQGLGECLGAARHGCCKSEGGSDMTCCHSNIEPPLQTMFPALCPKGSR